MKVKMKYFASLRELIGVGEEEYDVKDGTTLRELLVKYIPEKHKEAAGAWMERIAGILKGDKEGYILIINGNKADLNQRLDEGDVVALLPPVGGG